jgi:hypothetical protein
MESAHGDKESVLGVKTRRFRCYSKMAGPLNACAKSAALPSYAYYPTPSTQVFWEHTGIP